MVAYLKPRSLSTTLQSDQFGSMSIEYLLSFELVDLRITSHDSVKCNLRLPPRRLCYDDASTTMEGTKECSKFLIVLYTICPPFKPSFTPRTSHQRFIKTNSKTIT